MKKIYFYAAALAVSAALSSCSESEVAEQIIEPVPAAKGTPIGFTAAIDGNTTRATDFTTNVDITSTSLQTIGFRLTGVKRTSENLATTDGSEGLFLAGEKSAQDYSMNTSQFNYATTGWTDGATYYWPKVEATFDFYATTRSIGSATTSRSPFISAIVNNTESDDTEGGISYPQFSYRLPASAANQEDLGVASKLGVSKEDGDTLKLRFKHALSRIKVQAIFKESETETNPTTSTNWVGTECRAWIKSVKFHGLADKAKFSFSTTDESTGSWGVAESHGIITMDFGDTPKEVQSNDPTTTDEGATWNDGERTHLGYIYVIPEAKENMTAKWNFQNNKPVKATEALAINDPDNGITGKAYIEIECCIAEHRGARPARYTDGESTMTQNVTITSKSEGKVYGTVNNVEQQLDKEINTYPEQENDVEQLLATAGWDFMVYDKEAVANNVILKAVDAYGWGLKDEGYYSLHGGSSLVYVLEDEGDETDGSKAYENVPLTVGYGTIYIPLNIPNGFEFNKDYTLTINLQKGAQLTQDSDDQWCFSAVYNASISEDN
jgi:hypothetical protein